jgi:hypothetical protein
MKLESPDLRSLLMGPELPALDTKRRIGFLDKAETISGVLPKLGTPRANTRDDVIALDASAHPIAFDVFPVHAPHFPAPFFRVRLSKAVRSP